MPEYQFFFLNRNGVTFGQPLVGDCASDKEAITEARCHVKLHDIEIWEGTRIVTRVEARNRDGTGSSTSPVAAGNGEMAGPVRYLY